jgi:hypothetical protein
MKDLVYSSQPDESVSELRLITRSLMLLALVTAGLYVRGFVGATFFK